MGQTDEQEIEKLIDALRDKDEKVRNIAITSLIQIGEPAIAALFEVLLSQNNQSDDDLEEDYTYKAVLDSLKGIGEPLLRFLVEVLKNGEWWNVNQLSKHWVTWATGKQ